MPDDNITPVTSSLGPSPQTATHNDIDASTTGDYYQAHFRPSLSRLQTRSTYPEHHESQYESTPHNAYLDAYSSIPRQASVASTLSNDGNPYWTATATMPTQISAAYYEPQPICAWGSLHASAAPQTQQLPIRHPSVTTESYPGLNMSSLHSSLPSQMVQERHLPMPAPNMVHYQQNPAATAEMRPRGSYSDPRMYITGTHSHNAMSWVDSSSVASRSGSTASTAPLAGLPITSNETTTAVSEPVVGYEFSHGPSVTDANSPEISPTTGPPPSFDGGSTSGSSPGLGLPPPNIMYSASGAEVLPSMVASTRRSSSRRTAHAPSLYSFSTDASEHQSVNNEANETNNFMPRSTSYSTSSMHSQPQLPSTGNVDTLHRQSSFDQQRAYTAQRMSVSNLNANY